jgi:hypothetical protein
VNADEALRDIRGYAAAGRLRYTHHAKQRMLERGMRRDHVRHALACARECRRAEGERWRVTGDDLDGDELTAIVVLAQGVLVVTLF